MQLTEIEFNGQPPIDAYGPGFFRVFEKAQEGPLLILPEGVKAWAGLKDAAPLLDAAGKVDVLFMGMGADIAPLPKALKAKLEAARVPYELINSPAACRTYNVLLSEGRRVGIAALPIE